MQPQSSRGGTGGMREQERMTPASPTIVSKAPGGSASEDRLAANSAGGKLDAVPRQHVCGDEFDESLQRPAAQLGLRASPSTRADPDSTHV